MLLCLDVYEGFKFKCPISPAIAAVPCQLLAVRTGTYDINGKAGQKSCKVSRCLHKPEIEAEIF